MKLRFFTDLPPTAWPGYCFTASTLAPCSVPITGWKRVVFYVDVPDTVMREADVFLSDEATTCVGEVPA